MSTPATAAKVEENFSSVYANFKEFQRNESYRGYWDICMEAVRDEELLSHIVFCNDVFSIPPVKTFLTCYRDDFIRLTGRENAQLDVFVKKSIGAFWGMVFKSALGYRGQKSVSVSMYDYFIVKTATYFIKDEEEQAMAITTGGGSKKCATCQFFSGARKTDPSKRSVSYEANAAGRCTANLKSVTAGAGGCFRWKKWDGLRG